VDAGCLINVLGFSSKVNIAFVVAVDSPSSSSPASLHQVTAEKQFERELSSNGLKGAHVKDVPYHCGKDYLRLYNWSNRACTVDAEVANACPKISTVLVQY